jgi:hypothetical protein
LLLLSIDPSHYFIQNFQISIIFYSDLKSDDSVDRNPFQSLKIQVFKLLIAIEANQAIEVILNLISNESIIDESISDSDEIVLQEFSCLFVESEHKLVHICTVNIHHDIECEVCVIS